MAAPISASVIPDSETSRRAVLMSMPHCDTRPHQRQYERLIRRRIVAVGTWGGGDPPSDIEGGTSSLLLVAAAVAGLVALSAVPRLAFSLAAVLLAGAVAGNVAGAAVGWGVAAVVAVALYRAQR